MACTACRSGKKPKFGACSCLNKPKFGACKSQVKKSCKRSCNNSSTSINEIELEISKPTYINNPYYDYVDYYIMMDGRNRRTIHRCGLEDHYKKRIFDGINLSPHVHRNQYYSLLIGYLKGVYEDILRNKIFHPNLNADQSAKLLIKRVLKTLVGEFEAIKIMHLWDITACKVCTDIDYSDYRNAPEWTPINWKWNKSMNANWGPEENYYGRNTL